MAECLRLSFDPAWYLWGAGAVLFYQAVKPHTTAAGWFVALLAALWPVVLPATLVVSSIDKRLGKRG